MDYTRTSGGRLEEAIDIPFDALISFTDTVAGNIIGHESLKELALTERAVTGAMDVSAIFDQIEPTFDLKTSGSGENLREQPVYNQGLHSSQISHRVCKQPSSQPRIWDWEQHKARITELYKTHELKNVMKIMNIEHGLPQR